MTSTTISSSTNVTETETNSISESDSEEEPEILSVVPPSLSNNPLRLEPPRINPVIYPVQAKISHSKTRTDKVAERDQDLFLRDSEMERKRKAQAQKEPPQSSHKKSNKTTRWNFKNFFLTYPRCPVSKEEALNQLQRLSDPVSRSEANPIIFAMVAQELHQDGTPHLHVILSFSRAKNIKDPRFFDLNQTSDLNNNNSTTLKFHANIQGVKKMKSSISYLRKQDKSPLIFGAAPGHDQNTGESSSTNDSKGRKKGPSITNEISIAVQAGEKFQALLDKYPGFVMMNKTKIDELAAYVKYSKATANVLPWKPILYRGDQEETRTLVTWANANLFQQRPFKQAQLYVSGPPNSRKTSFAQFLSTRARTYYCAHDKYLDNFDESLYDLVVFDEFNSKDRDKSVMLSFLDGQVCRLLCRFRNVAKTINLPVILLSMFSLNDQYVGDNVTLGAMRVRLLEVTLKEDAVIDMENLSFQEEDQ